MEPPFIWNPADRVLTIYYDQTTDDWREQVAAARQALGFSPERVVTTISIPEGLLRKMAPYRKCKNP